MKRSEFLIRAEFLFPCDQAELIAEAAGLTDDDAKPTPGTEAWRIAGLQEEITNLRETNKRLTSNSVERQDSLREQLANESLSAATFRADLDTVATAIFQRDAESRFTYSAPRIVAAVAKLREERDAAKSALVSLREQLTAAQKEAIGLRALLANKREDYSEARTVLDCVKVDLDRTTRERDEAAGALATYKVAIGFAISGCESTYDVGVASGLIGIRELAKERDEAKAVASALTVRVAELERAPSPYAHDMKLISAAVSKTPGTAWDIGTILGQIDVLHERVADLERYAASITTKSDRERAVRFYWQHVSDFEQDWIDGGSGEGIDQDVKDYAAHLAKVRASDTADVERRIAEAVANEHSAIIVAVRELFSASDDLNDYDEAINDAIDVIRARGTAPGKAGG